MADDEDEKMRAEKRGADSLFVQVVVTSYKHFTTPEKLKVAEAVISDISSGKLEVPIGNSFILIAVDGQTMRGRTPHFCNKCLAFSLKSYKTCENCTHYSVCENCRIDCECGERVCKRCIVHSLKCHICDGWECRKSEYMTVCKLCSHKVHNNCSESGFCGDCFLLIDDCPECDGYRPKDSRGFKICADCGGSNYIKCCKGLMVNIGECCMLSNLCRGTPRLVCKECAKTTYGRAECVSCHYILCRCEDGTFTPEISRRECDRCKKIFCRGCGEKRLQKGLCKECIEDLINVWKEGDEAHASSSEK